MIVERYDPFRTIDAKGWDNIQVYDDYHADVSDGKLLVITYGTKEQFKWAEALHENSFIWDWQYDDQVDIDREDNCAYTRPSIGELDIIALESGVIGRRVIENEEVVWEDLEEYYVDDHTQAIPSWYPTEQLEAVGYKELSCEFESGWYGIEDDPEKIARDLYDRGFTHVVFQLGSVSMFNMTFCVWGTRD